MENQTSATPVADLTPDQIAEDNAAFLRAAAAAAAADTDEEAAPAAAPAAKAPAPAVAPAAAPPVAPMPLEEAIAGVDPKIIAAVVAQQAAAGVKNEDAHAAIGLAAGELAAAGFSGAGIGTVLASIVGVKGYVSPLSVVATLAKIFDAKNFTATHSVARESAIREAAHLLGCKIG